jgi:hypothetical protein
VGAGSRALARSALVFFAAIGLLGCDQTLAPKRAIETQMRGTYGDFVFEVDSVRISSPYRWGDSLRVRFFVPPGKNACAFRSVVITDESGYTSSLIFYGGDRATTVCASYEVSIPRRYGGQGPDTARFVTCRPNGVPLRTLGPVVNSDSTKEMAAPLMHWKLPEDELKPLIERLCHSVPQKKKGWLFW